MKFTLKILMLMLNVILFAQPAQAEQWRHLAPGIDYQDLNANPLTPWSHIHVFRINLKKNQLDLASARQLSQHYASVNELAHKNHALVAINGGFFDQDFHPLGLRIRHHQQQSPMKRISWWGVFYLKNNTPYISSSWAFHPDPTIEFAVQSGPRLIINGKIPRLRPGTAQRTALGITKQDELIMLVTENTLLTTTELAQRMKSAPIHCVNALNLDGGSSSQLFAKFNALQINVHGFSNISDAILVKPKARSLLGGG